MELKFHWLSWMAGHCVAFSCCCLWFSIHFATTDMKSSGLKSTSPLVIARASTASDPLPSCSLVRTAGGSGGRASRITILTLVNPSSLAASAIALWTTLGGWGMIHPPGMPRKAPLSQRRCLVTPLMAARMTRWCSGVGCLISQTVPRDAGSPRSTISKTRLVGLITGVAMRVCVCVGLIELMNLVLF